jgi:hypothetical protein
LLLQTTAEALAAMATDEKKLQEEIARLTDRLQQLTLHRDTLLAAIKNVQNSQHTFKLQNVSRWLKL